MTPTPEIVSDARMHILGVIHAALTPGPPTNTETILFHRAVNPMHEDGKLTAVVLSRILSGPDETTRAMDWWKSTPSGERLRTLETALDELPAAETGNDSLDAVLSLEYAAIRLDMPDGGPNTARWITNPRYPAGKIAHDAALAELETAGLVSALWVDLHRWLASSQTSTLQIKRILRRAARRILAGKPLASGTADQ